MYVVICIVAMQSLSKNRFTLPESFWQMAPVLLATLTGSDTMQRLMPTTTGSPCGRCLFVVGVARPRRWCWPVAGWPWAVGRRPWQASSGTRPSWRNSRQVPSVELRRILQSRNSQSLFLKRSNRFLAFKYWWICCTEARFYKIQLITNKFVMDKLVTHNSVTN